ncbi:MAG: DUF1156 domain-containing protein, partial [Euryarchaeota archaeon]|nr:DUF1156 domain-containing protein [Euryarchaeota archaeon]
MTNTRRFIEDSFPVKEVSIESAKEKSIRQGHISTLHIWWARRPLASSRATNYAALIPAPDNIDEWNKTRQFIIDFSKWENSLNPTLIEKARQDILKANGGKPPKVLDPFGGGGSIPLEALRLGCETYSSDLNPVAVLIQKCTLEYPQKYGRPSGGKESWGELSDSSKNPLLEDVKKWGDWVLEETKKEIGSFYPGELDGSIPVGYIWARTIPCQNPSCGAEIPLMRQFWLAKKEKKKVSLFPYVENRKVNFKIVGDGYENMPSTFNPENGTVSRAIATCLVCGSMVDGKITRKLFQEGKDGKRMVAVVLHNPKKKGKTQRLAMEKDLEIFREAENYLERKIQELNDKWGFNPIPDEDIPIVHTITQRPFAPRENYGIMTWGDLFNSRQKLALITFIDKIKQAHEKLLAEGVDEDFARSVVSYLALSLDWMANKYSTLAFYDTVHETITQTFNMQNLPMSWDYMEINPFNPSTGGISSNFKFQYKVINFLSKTSNISAITNQYSSTSPPYPDNFFDAVFTDPPYYDNVPYSHLSDFFYVWLKRTVGHLYPDLFSTPLTPKSNEIVAYSNVKDGFEIGKQFFESMLKKSFQEIHRVLKPDGITTIVYAHKSTEGWETLINSL